MQADVFKQENDLKRKLGVADSVSAELPQELCVMSADDNSSPDIAGYGSPPIKRYRGVKENWSRFHDAALLTVKERLDKDLLHRFITKDEYPHIAKCATFEIARLMNESVRCLPVCCKCVSSAQPLCSVASRAVVMQEESCGHDSRSRDRQIQDLISDCVSQAKKRRAFDAVTGSRHSRTVDGTVDGALGGTLGGTVGKQRASESRGLAT